MDSISISLAGAGAGITQTTSGLFFGNFENDLMSATNNGRYLIGFDHNGRPFYGERPTEIGFMDVKVENKKNLMRPRMYFEYVKKNFSKLENKKISQGIKKIEKAFDKAVSNGQIALGKKLLKKVVISTKELIFKTKGFEYFIEKDILNENKRNIRDGHISDTNLKDYTRIIPEDVIEKLNKVKNLFDDFIIYHYWNEDCEDVKNMTEQEKDDMKDPVLFGTIKENDKFYFIADWEDEFCDLTFDEMIEELGCDKKDLKIAKKIDFSEEKED